MSIESLTTLNKIFVLLEPIADREGGLQAIALEARVVITARLAFNSFSESKSSQGRNRQHEHQSMYQKALSLLQDPILPVRAHGLLLLRELVTPRSLSISDEPPVDAALVPSIITIFLQCIQDEDSYIFLNAVQGLAAAVDTYGMETLQRLIHVYTERLDGLAVSNLKKPDIEKRLRIAEAFAHIIRRCGQALVLYGI